MNHLPPPQPAAEHRTVATANLSSFDVQWNRPIFRAPQLSQLVRVNSRVQISSSVFKKKGFTSRIA